MSEGTGYLGPDDAASCQQYTTVAEGRGQGEVGGGRNGPARRVASSR
jgi:hypothetical protein